MKKKRPAIHYVPATKGREKYENWGWASLAETVECANNIRGDNPEFLNPGEKLEIGETTLLLLFGSLMRQPRDEYSARQTYAFIENGRFLENYPLLPYFPETAFVPYGWASDVLRFIEHGVHRIEIEEIIPKPDKLAVQIRFWAIFRDGKKQKIKGSGKGWVLYQTI